MACVIQDIDIKYIDPTYMIRAIPTTTNDRIYCKVLGQGAVHGAFAGFTGCTVGLVNTHYVYLPIPVIIQVTCLFIPRLISCRKKTPITAKLVCTIFGLLWEMCTLMRTELQELACSY